jgi:hypothetical protein
MRYRVKGACIVDKYGAVLYDLLEDMPVETRRRLAELHSADKHERLDWEAASARLEREGYKLTISKQEQAR